MTHSKFYVFQIIWQAEIKEFAMMNPDGSDEPCTFDTYPLAEDWIKNKGRKGKNYQIQKFLIP